MKSHETIDAYIKDYPEEIQVLLQKMREVIHKAAPRASEAIKYGIPTFVFHGNLVHFGAFKTHISFFPASSGVLAFKNELVKYKTAKGTIQLPLDKSLPIGLIQKIVKFRVKENLEKAELKSKKK